MNKLMHKDKVQPAYKKLTYGTAKSSAPAVIVARDGKEARSLHEQLTAMADTPKANNISKIISRYLRSFPLSRVKRSNG